MYSAEISRRNPALLIFLIDQSGSMEDAFGGDPSAKKKKNGVAEAINRLLSEIINRCSPPDVKDRFDISVLGYGAGKVSSVFGGNLAVKEIAKVSEIYQNPLRIEEIEGKKYRVWLDPLASGDTPMCLALNKAYELAEAWVKDHPASYPPTIFNITDGEATDGEPGACAEKIKSLTTDDGNALIYNCHISSQQAQPILYPFSETALPDDKFANLLFKMSSELPDGIRNKAKEIVDMDLQSNSRGFVFNANITEVIRLLDIGTRAAVQR